MECPHLLENVKIVDLDILIPEKTEASKEWQCAVCSTPESPWLCLQCGVVNCGRYINGHAKDHSEESQGHKICMDCKSLSVFCYSCDEFVGNDTTCGHLQNLRQQFVGSTNSVGELNDDSSSRDDDDGSWKSDLVSKEMQDGSRALRPRSRKRSNCMDSESSDDAASKRQNVDVLSVAPVSKSKKVVGLRNLGNTCFMNAVLQSLSNIQPFCYYFKQLPSLESEKNGRTYHSRSYKEVNQAVMAEELRKVLISLTQEDGSKSAISPESLFLVIWKVVPRFRGYQQQDAHEFLRYMLDRLHTELLLLLPDGTQKDSSYFSLAETLKGRTSIVTSIFGGTLQSEVRCLNCNGESKKHDPFLDLSLDIPDQFLNKTEKSNGAPACDITDCLRSFVEVEELADTELYLCNTCQSKQRSTKRFWIRQLPNVLCLHLKRFRWYSGFRTKIDTKVSFPVRALDMTPFMLNPSESQIANNNVYDLAAVIVHHGSGAGSGHYTAFAVNEGGWFHFNDSMVRPSDATQVAQSKAYILFYVRREFQIPIDAS